MAKPRTAQAEVERYGIDAICADIANRESLTTIAIKIGVSTGTLLTWIEADPERSARAREARTATATLWDEQAEAEIRNAKDDLNLRKAKELAHHYRWRAKAIAPREYGEAVTLKGDKDNPLVVRKTVDLDDAELARIAAQARAGGDGGA